MEPDSVVRPPDPPPASPKSWFHATTGLWQGIGTLFANVGVALIIAVIATMFLWLLSSDGVQKKCAEACGVAGVAQVSPLACVCK